MYILFTTHVNCSDIILAQISFILSSSITPGNPCGPGGPGGPIGPGCFFISSSETLIPGRPGGPGGP